MSLKHPSKALKAFLFLSVLFIWSAIGYRIYAKINKKAYYLETTASEDQGPSIDKEDAEEYKLLLNTPNPFYLDYFDNYTDTFNLVQSPPDITPTVIEPPVIKPPIEFPDLQYRGFVRLKSGREAALIWYKHQLIHWPAGDELDGMVLLNFLEDSIQVRYHGERHGYPRLRQ